MAAAEVGDRLLPIGGGEGLEPVVFEGITQSLADHEVLIDYQDVRFMSHGSAFFSSSLQVPSFGWDHLGVSIRRAIDYQKWLSPSEYNWLGVFQSNCRLANVKGFAARALPVERKFPDPLG